MKKLVLSFCLLVAAHQVVNAQDILKKASGVATAAGFDVKSLTTSIVGKLVPALAVTSQQKPGVTSAISSFLGDKAKILSLKTSDPAAYTTKQTSLFSTLKTKLATALVASQVNKFMGLKPATNDPANVLSNLFF